MGLYQQFYAFEGRFQSHYKFPLPPPTPIPAQEAQMLYYIKNISDQIDGKKLMGTTKS